LHEKNENLPMPGGCPGGGWSQLELTDALVKVVFVNDKVQAKDILDNMDVHNFAVNLFRQSGTGRTAVCIVSYLNFKQESPEA
jgi:predicted acetyltransferase